MESGWSRESSPLGKLPLVVYKENGINIQSLTNGWLKHMHPARLLPHIELAKVHGVLTQAH